MLRSEMVDPTRSQVMHLYARCARGGHLFGSGADAEGVSSEVFKLLLLRLLERLAGAMSFRVFGFALMDNHLHVLIESNPDRASGWSAEEVARRWVGLHPSPAAKRDAEVFEAEVQTLLADPARIATTREKLSSVSQFAKDLLQPAAQGFNRLSREALGKHRARGGSVFQGRFGLTLPRGPKQWLETLAHIDLNPFAAGLGDDVSSVCEAAGGDLAAGRLTVLGAPPAGVWTSLETWEALGEEDPPRSDGVDESGVEPAGEGEVAGGRGVGSGPTQSDAARERCRVAAAFLPRFRAERRGAYAVDAATHRAIRAAGPEACRGAAAMVGPPRSLETLFERLTFSAYRRFVAIVASRLRRGKRSSYAATPAQRRAAIEKFGRELWAVLDPPWEWAA